MIDVRLLKAKGACAPQVTRFRELFGDGPAPMTVEAAVAVASEFDWDWAAVNLLSAPAWKLYDETRDAAWKLYVETRARVYDETCDAARKLYVETCARVFAELYLNPENRT